MRPTAPKACRRIGAGLGAHAQDFLAQVGIARALVQRFVEGQVHFLPAHFVVGFDDGAASSCSCLSTARSSSVMRSQA